MHDARSVLNDVAVKWGERELDAEARGSWRLPSETVVDIRKSGLLAAPLPTALGGWGLTLAQTADAIRVLARKAPSTALALTMPWGNTAMARLPEELVDPSARAEQKSSAKWLAERALEGAIVAVANSEPGSHGDLSATKTTADNAGGRYVLSGRKAFATFGPDADYFMCAARRVDGATAVVDGFFVARAAAGVTLDEKWNAWGMRSTASVGLTLDRAAASAMYGYPGALTSANARHWSTVLFGAVFVGIGEGAVDLAAKQVSATSVWARAKLAEHMLNLEAAWGFVLGIAIAERLPFPSTEAARARSAKTFAARTALSAANDALAVSGSRAYGATGLAAKLIADAAAGSLLRPPLSVHMDELVHRLGQSEAS